MRQPAAAPSRLTFDTVTQPGDTVLVIGAVGPPPPPGFEHGNPPRYYDLSTTAAFTGSVEVCVSYAGTTFGGVPTLWHFENAAWANITIRHDPAQQEICGDTLSLSPLCDLPRVAAAPRRRPRRRDASVTYTATASIPRMAGHTLCRASGSNSAPSHPVTPARTCNRSRQYSCATATDLRWHGHRSSAEARCTQPRRPSPAPTYRHWHHIGECALPRMHTATRHAAASPSASSSACRLDHRRRVSVRARRGRTLLREPDADQQGNGHARDIRLTTDIPDRRQAEALSPTTRRCPERCRSPSDRLTRARRRLLAGCISTCRPP